MYILIAMGRSASRNCSLEDSLMIAVTEDCCCLVLFLDHVFSSRSFSLPFLSNTSYPMLTRTLHHSLNYENLTALTGSTHKQRVHNQRITRRRNNADLSCVPGSDPAHSASLRCKSERELYHPHAMHAGRSLYISFEEWP